MEWGGMNVSFERYVADRVTILKKLQKGEHNCASTSVLGHYLSLLLSMLRHQLLHHSFTMATAVMETISMAMDEVPDVMLTVGVGILTLNKAEVTYHSKLQLLKDLFNRYPKHGVWLLLQRTLFIAAHGNLQEAYTTLGSEVHAEPFKSDVMVNGWSATLQYLMWKKEVWPEGGGEAEGVWPGGVVKAVHGDVIRAAAHSKQSLQHFQTLEDLHPPPSYLVDSFVAMHSHLLVALGQSGGLNVLTSYRDRAPHRMTACRLVCDYVRRHEGVDDLIPHLQLLVRVDESCPEALELAELLRTDPAHDSEVKEILKNFLYYPHNRDNSSARSLLHRVQRQKKCRKH